MKNDLLEMVLPRLSRRIDRQLKRYREGQLNDDQFSDRFEALLKQQHAWLANQGVSDVEAAIAVHGALLVISGPGLKAEAREQRTPLEVVEWQAVATAAEDIAENYNASALRVVKKLSTLVSRYVD
jgi:hypothetical protein